MITPVADICGFIIVLSGPSGSGKSSISQGLIAMSKSFVLSTSYTTRAPRPGEIDRKHYFFVNQNTFQTMLHNQEFVEHTKNYGNYYGTSISELNNLLSKKAYLF